MKSLIVFAALFCVVLSAEDAHYKRFQEWASIYNKIYDSPLDHVARFEIYKDNEALVNHLNRQEKGTFKLNQFADLTQEEFAAQYLHPIPFTAQYHPVDYTASNKVNKDSLNWCDEGACNPVKNQEQCGSCWAFSTVANMEGVTFKTLGYLPNLSEQQLVDCDHECMDFPGTTQKVCDEGCNGGLMPNAMTYAIKNGMMTEEEYSYKGKAGTCTYDEIKAKTHFSHWQWVDKNEDAMVSALNEFGPLSIAVDATYWSYYSGGIYDSSCSTTRMNHGVALVGYGSENGKDYWIVRNSWGPFWGKSGYIWLIRGKNKCGINNFVSTITV